MTRNQMLCIVTPGAPAALTDAVRADLDALLAAAGCIHFATLALLPPEPGDAADEEPSLLFEVVVDEGMTPEATIDLLVTSGPQTLLSLYAHAWTGPAQADMQVRLNWLADWLKRHTTAAAGGFVGVRDRTVVQILSEQRLQQQVKASLRSITPGAQGPGTPRLDDAQIAAVTQGFAQDPSHRSLWRPGVLPDHQRWPLMAVRLVVPVLALMSALGLLGLLIASPPWLLTVLGFEHVAEQVMSSHAAIPLWCALAILVTLVLVAMALLACLVQPAAWMLLLMLLSLVTVLAALAVFFNEPAWAKIWCGLQLGVVGLLALGSVVSGWGTIAALLVTRQLWRPPFAPLAAALGAIALASTVTFALSWWTRGLLSDLECCALRWQRPGLSNPWSELAWIAISTAALVVLLGVLQHLLPWIARRTRQWLAELDRPTDVQATGLHQVHPSVLACEARLVGRQSHMINLSELRRPVAWSRFKVRIVLWIVQQLGEVFFTYGRLGKADGIKFGHWHIVGRGKGTRLLFCSNYDGTFGGYLDEFIRGASQGVNLIWGQTELRPRRAAADGHPDVPAPRSFPPRRLGMFGGCKNEQAFKAYARAGMIPHLYRFEAYNLSQVQIEAATRLRDALCLPASPQKSDQILRSLER